MSPGANSMQPQRAPVDAAADCSLRALAASVLGEQPATGIRRGRGPRRLPQRRPARAHPVSAARLRRRLALSPRPVEVAFFAEAWHREHFGVFTATRFDVGDATASWRNRLTFAARLLTARSPGELGPWPYATCLARGGPGLAALYRGYKRWRGGL